MWLKNDLSQDGLLRALVGKKLLFDWAPWRWCQQALKRFGPERDTWVWMHSVVHKILSINCNIELWILTKEKYAGWSRQTQVCSERFQDIKWLTILNNKHNFCKKCCQRYLREHTIITLLAGVNTVNPAFQHGGNVPCVKRLSAFITRDDVTRLNVAQNPFRIWKEIQKRNPKLFLQNKKNDVTMSMLINIDACEGKWKMLDVLTCLFGWCWKFGLECNEYA